MIKNRASHIVSRRLWLILGCLVLLLAAAGGLAYSPLFPPALKVTFINVTEHTDVGDAILLQSSEGKVLLIDGGEKGSGALDYLQSQHITHIDTVVLTHAHEDHFGGLIDVLGAIPVDQVVTNGETVDRPQFHEFVEAVRKSGAKEVVVKSGDRLRFGRLSFQVLSPRKINPDSTNNNSIVMQLAVGKVSFLFTGDTMKLEEARLLATDANLQANILKVAHHGIDTSSSGDFLLRVQPEVAVYSVMPGNIYGAPNPKLLEDLQAVGSDVYGTDIYGTITIETDGKTYTISTERENPADS